MLVQDSEDLGLLLKLIDADVMDPIGELREIRLGRIAEKEARAREMGLNTEYRLQRIERVPAYSPNGDAAGTAERGVEILRLKFRDFPQWSKQAGVKPELLQAVVESREKQVIDKKGNVWRAYPFLWTDRTPTQEDIDDREADIRADRDFAIKQATREANKKAAAKSIQTAPIISVYGDVNR